MLLRFSGKSGRNGYLGDRISFLYNRKVDFKETDTDVMDWIQLAQHRTQCPYEYLEIRGSHVGVY